MYTAMSPLKSIELDCRKYTLQKAKITLDSSLYVHKYTQTAYRY